MNVAMWLARRLAVIVIQLVVISIIVFGILFITPGDPEQILLGDRPATPETLAAIREKFHLDESFVGQYWHWLTSALHFDFGSSVQYGQSVSSVIGERVGITAFLAVYALVIVVAIAIPFGLAAGSRPGSIVDRATTILGTFGLSAPPFAVGILLLYLFGVVMGLPVFGSGDSFVSRLQYLALPAITLSISVIALVSRQTRAASINVFNQDYMTFAKARGLPRPLIWRRYALRNSALPVVTSTGMVIAYFLSGSVVVEQTFALPGLGSLVLQAVSSKDVPVVQALALLAAFFVLLVNLVTDIAYMLIDPRIRQEVFS